jgi:hypothetical protein
MRKREGINLSTTEVFVGAGFTPARDSRDFERGWGFSNQLSATPTRFLKLIANS